MTTGIYPRSLQQRRNISKGLKGRPSPMKGRRHSDKTRKQMSSSHKGLNDWSKGRRLSIEHRRKLSEATRQVIAEGRHNFYIDGRATGNVKIRRSLEYRLWREAVFARDNWTCVWCGQRGSKLNADHIKSFAENPELRFAIDNGRTLCKSCHQKTDTYGWKYANKLLAIKNKK